jgi:hypothetical protein
MFSSTEIVGLGEDGSIAFSSGFSGSGFGSLDFTTSGSGLAGDFSALAFAFSLAFIF